MDTITVKPAPGRQALHEEPPHAPIAAAGETVPASPYYLRQRDLHHDTVDMGRAARSKSTRKPKKEA
jgi:hypothetical protein